MLERAPTADWQQLAGDASCVSKRGTQIDTDVKTGTKAAYTAQNP